MTSIQVARFTMPYMDVPRCASPELIRFAAIYPASLVDLMTRAMMLSAPCFLITTSVCHYHGTVQAITGSVYRSLISTCKLRRNAIAQAQQWSTHSESPVDVKTC